MIEIQSKPELSATQVRQMAHLKRLAELWQGDAEFRSAAGDHPDSRNALLAERGIALQADEVAPFWGVIDAERAGREGRESAVLQWESHPVGRLWERWARESKERLLAAGKARFSTGSARFDAWRRRQIARTRSESYVPSMDEFAPPLFAFELSKGCSKQCWFCSFAPPKLQNVFLHTGENRRLWREVLATAQDLFGTACRTGVCYHSTEPSDNPDYLEFLEDFHDLIGVYPQTTTADPLKDVEWTRRMLGSRQSDPTNVDRFSVLTLRALREIHRTFSAEELLDVTLVLQNKGALTIKNECGRALDHLGRLRREQDEMQTMTPQGLAITPQLTLECTVGFLVNMVDRSIRLISPCNASDRSPLGCIVHAEGTFEDAAGFRDFVVRATDQCVAEHLGRDDRLAFRDDLVFESGDDGFSLVARYLRHDLRGNPHFRALGELVGSGAHTTGEVLDRLIGDGMPAPAAIAWLDRLYQKGLLAEPAIGGLRPEAATGIVGRA